MFCPDQSQVGCRELRSTKYISDGQCTSVNPIKELVCAGECLPAHLLPNWIGSGSYTGRYWSRRDSQEWRCIIDKTRTQRIQLQCQDGSSRTYKITVVTACKCKRYSRQQNDSGHKDTSVSGGKQRKNPRKSGHPEEKAGRQSEDWSPCMKCTIITKYLKVVEVKENSIDIDWIHLKYKSTAW